MSQDDGGSQFLQKGQLLSDSSNTERNVSFLSVTGIGGLGKTALAQLVFDDERVKSAFTMRLWTCVSDHGQEGMNLTGILTKILESAIDQKLRYEASLEQVQQRLRAKLAGKRFLLVLDDVWNDNREQWDKLAGFLMGGHRGSWVLVTTRSEQTASAMRDEHAYKLKGLTKENSWDLFKKMAFARENLPEDLVEIGQSILKRCANVPLAIRVVGSSLRGKSMPEWRSFQRNWLASISRNEVGIMHALRFSYHELKPPLRSCFSYCAIFPKDYEISKDMLFGLWMAQGYISPPSQQSERIDDAEAYFLDLLQKCFFQDAKTNEYGEYVSCKIHDLIHDLAQEVSAKEICDLASNTVNTHELVRHVAVGKDMPIFSTKTSIRTYLQVSRVGGRFLMNNILANCPRLRTLDLRGTEFKILSKSIAKLLHLRYLDLSYNVKLKMLPKSITKLHNLQTLNLLGCKGLGVLPDDLSKLVNLRVLDVKDCYLPLYMPHNFGKLTHLQKLDRFGMGGSRPRGKKKQLFHQMEDLKALVNLKGSLGIQIGPTKDATYEAKGGAYMSTLEHLNGVEIWYLRHEPQYCERAAYEEALLEDLRPHPNLKHYRLVEYYGGTMPTWAREHNLASSLPNLVKIEFNHCLELERLPWLGRLRHLKSIGLDELPKLEYVTDWIPLVDSDPVSNGKELSLFPCLEYLFLQNLPKLKEWWPSSLAGMGKAHLPLLCLPNLKGLWIYMCPQMAPNLRCPLVEDLRVADANRCLALKVVDEENRKLSLVSPLPSSSQTGTRSFPKQMRLTTGNIQLLSSVPSENFQCLVELRIESDNKLKSFSEVEDLFQSRLSSLQTLEIWRCLKLRSLSGGLEHLSALEKLHIRRAPDLMLCDAPADAGNDAIPWRSLAQTLHSLKLQDLSQLVHLPEGMQNLASLVTLSIVNCTELVALPTWLIKLTSLKTLEVRRCSTGLKARCDNPTGEDWHNIQHIPSIIIEDLKSSGR